MIIHQGTGRLHPASVDGISQREFCTRSRRQLDKEGRTNPSLEFPRGTQTDRQGDEVLKKNTHSIQEMLE